MESLAPDRLAAKLQQAERAMLRLQTEIDRRDQEIRVLEARVKWVEQRPPQAMAEMLGRAVTRAREGLPGRAYRKLKRVARKALGRG